MAFPTTQIGTTNLDSSSDDPSLARADLLLAVQSLNTIIAEAGGANGVALLNGSNELPSSRIPSSLSPSGTLTLSPGSGRVKIEDVLRLQQLTTDDVLALTDNQAGDLVYVTDGDSGESCLAVYSSDQWNVVQFKGTISKTVVVSMAAAATIACVVV